MLSSSSSRTILFRAYTFRSLGTLRRHYKPIRDFIPYSPLRRHSVIHGHAALTRELIISRRRRTMSSTQAEQETQVPAPDSSNNEQPQGTESAAAPPPMSKNALKRLRRQQEWEEGKDERRKKRKEKRHERKGRLRQHREALRAQGVDISELHPPRKPSTRVPIALIVDCDFEKYMTDKERISLSSQVTRSYSDNRWALFRSHMWVAGWNGKLRERFEGPLERQHKSWKGVGFHEGDFAECALRAAEAMREDGGEMIASLERSLKDGVEWTRDETDPFPLPDPEPEPSEEYADVVYLTSESPYTLERLEPNKCYVIGGLVDKNREKGLCYRRARERGIRTAKLPIGRFMKMQSRQVLATNHVVEIMLKWLEYEDWGAAFEAVIPKRKGGVLRGQTESEDGAGDEQDEDGDEPIEAEAVETQDDKSPKADDEPVAEKESA